MSFQPKSTWPCNPQTTRGVATKLTGTKDGRIVYTNGKAVIIRDINTPALCLAYSGHVHPVNIARVSPSGYYCASGDSAGNVRIWDTSYLKTSFPPNSVEPPILKAEYKPLAGRISDIAWDCDSQRIIAVGESREKFGAAFLVDSGSASGEIIGHSKVVNAVSIRQQRPFRAVTASDDTTIVFHQGVPYKFDKSIRTHTRFVQDVKYSPDGEVFISVGSDAKAFLYDGKTGDTISELGDAHKGSIMGVSWSPDSKFFVTSSADCTVKLWDANTKQAVNTWTVGSGVSHQQMGNTWTGESPDVGIVSLSLNGDLNVFDRRVGDKPSSILYGPQKGVTTAALVDSTLFTGSYDGRVVAFDGQGEATRFEENVGHGSQISGMAVSSQKIYSVGFDDTVREIDADKRDFTPLAVSLTSQPRGIATVASGSNTVYIISENAVHVVQDGQQVFTLPVNYKAASIAVATDGSTVAVGSDDTKVYLYEWDGQGLRDVGKLESNRAGVSALSFSPDGVALAAGDSAGKIVVYDVKERKMLTSRWVGHSGRITSLAWTNDSKHCASGSVDTHVYVWSLVKPLRNIPIRNAVPGGVSVVTWLSATTVAGAGADGCVRSWDIQFHA